MKKKKKPALDAEFSLQLKKYKKENAQSESGSA
jgi:hypothetical protein